MGLDMIERFMAKVEQQLDCWRWLPPLAPTGYGQFWVKDQGRSVQAHRVAYELFVGPIPDGLQIDHLCRHRWCVNPTHLEPVTCRENLLRGDTLNARNVAKTHCPQGHPYSTANTAIKRGRTGGKLRMCRTCHRDRESLRRKVA